MAKSRFMASNYLDETVDITASSEAAAFPLTNLVGGQRRSKPYRSSGNWEFPVGSRSIVFQEGGGDLTATIGASYASATLLCAGIKAALEAAGAGTYQVTYNSTTKKFTLQMSVGPEFTLRWTADTALGDLLGFDTSADMSGSIAYEGDESRIHTSEWIKWDMGIPSNPRAFIMIGARNAPIRLSATAIVKVQGNATDTWDSPAFETIITYDSEAISHVNADGFHTEPLRWWRVEVIDPSNVHGFVEIGALYLGDFFEPTRGGVTFPFSQRQVDLSSTAYSSGGRTLSDVRQKTSTLSLNYAFLTVSEKEAIDDIFDSVGTTKPFFVQLDPDLVFSTRASKYIRYVKFEGEPAPTLESVGNFSYELSLREEL